MSLPSVGLPFAFTEKFPATMKSGNDQAKVSDSGWFMPLEQLLEELEYGRE